MLIRLFSVLQKRTAVPKGQSYGRLHCLRILFWIRGYTRHTENKAIPNYVVKTSFTSAQLLFSASPYIIFAKQRNLIKI